MDEIQSVHLAISACRTCEVDHIKIDKPVAMQRGHANAQVMAIGLAPGSAAINAGKAFAGNSLSRLLSWFCAAGYSLDETQFRSLVYLTSLNKCAAVPDVPANRRRMWSRCAPFLWRQIELIEPRLILVLGKEAADILLKSVGREWSDVFGVSLSTSRLFPGDLFESVRVDADWLFLPHPSGLSRTMNDPQVFSMVTRSLARALKRIDF